MKPVFAEFLGTFALVFAGTGAIVIDHTAGGVFPGQVNRHHWSFDDPAHAADTDEEKMAVFRRVRDEIRRAFEAYAAGRLDALRQLSVRS